MQQEEARPSSSGSVIYFPNHPKTYIYPRRQQTPSVQQKVTHGIDARPSSCGTMILYPDAPVTLIYPHKERLRSPQLNEPPSQQPRPEKLKRKRENSPPSDPAEQNVSSKTSALVVLLHQDLPMATDFAAFKHEFDSQGLDAEYRSTFDLDELIERPGDLIYGRDDIPGRSREVVLQQGHEKFYSIEPNVQKMKDGILKWLRTTAAAAQEGEIILLILISHGTRRGSVVVGGEKPDSPVDYITNLEVRNAVANLKRHTYFTLVNTACYSGGWVDIAQTGLGKRFVHTAATENKLASNFLSSSGKYRGGVFVTALLECLKRNPDGTLSEFVAEIKAEVAAYRNPRNPNVASAPSMSAVSNTSFWKRRIDAFVPIQTGSTLPETVMYTLEDIKSVKLAGLFEKIRPAKKAKIVPDEVVRELREAEDSAMARGGANGEEEIYTACQELLEGEAGNAAQEAVMRTVSWREKSMIQATRLARYLGEAGMMASEIASDVDEETLTASGDVFYKRVFSGSKLVDRSTLPPEGCIGGLWENPYTWLSNLIGASEEPVSITRLKDHVEKYLADEIIAQHKMSREIY